MEWFIALRYLRGKRKLGFISLITYFSIFGVFLGTSVLIVALSITNGFEKEVRDRIIGTLAHAKIMRFHHRPFDGYEDIRKKVEEHKEVVSASPFILGQGAIERDNILEGVMVYGIDPIFEEKVTEIGKSIKYGEFSLDSIMSKKNRRLPGILIGKSLADKIGVRTKAEIVVTSLVKVEGELDPVPTMIKCAVTGIFETGMYEYDSKLVYVSLRSAQRLKNIRGVEGIQFKVTDLNRAGEIAKEVNDNLGGYPFRSYDWKSDNESLFKWMKLEKLIISIVILLIVMIASFNIVSTLIMMILEKRREIGILMGMGCSSQSIMKIFLFNGAIIGLIGSITGTLFGVILCYIQYRWQLIPLPNDIYIINTLPVLIRITDIIGVFVVTNVICLTMALFPAWRASKIVPAESIRYE